MIITTRLTYIHSPVRLPKNDGESVKMPANKFNCYVSLIALCRKKEKTSLYIILLFLSAALRSLTIIYYICCSAVVFDPKFHQITSFVRDEHCARGRPNRVVYIYYC